ncbi:host specificity protein J [Xylophilus sp.]|uniref:host specificity protein J n=1 Tax=Xylophilus sp. TaxID=2653893 RepID=UPI0013B9702E|nr:phage tail protein [Xylophilus sp.]KAF1045598.1 MAG: hypothetical protein GAK38_02890 [Xylophilus sp.]
MSGLFYGRNKRMGIKPHITGAKGGGGQHTPVEAADTLRSISYFQIEDAISEGEIVGLVNGLQSVKLDGTPVANANGTLNFTGVSVQLRTGTQDQSYVPGYGDVKNEIGVQTELKSDAPWVRAVSNVELSAVAITLQVDALQQSNTKNGDINGYTVQYSIDVSTDGGAYQTVLNSAFSGKASNPYQRTHRIDLPRAMTGWSVRVRRLTANANSATTADTTRIISITEIIDAKLRYPNTAYVAISGDASQFSNVPARSYVCFGRILRVPANYDPKTRAYNGTWDGSFKPAWTDNPAWILYDMILNNRYGLGDLVDASLVDKWELYRIAQYCDQLVGDGKGGQEPRFRCTAYLQTRQDAFKVLGDMASIFRGVSYWMGGSLVTVADMPSDPVYPYTAANVIDGQFTYQSSARKTRFSTALVTWNDPANNYKQAVQYVEDAAAVARYGLQPTEFVAIGCTSQGQAHRAGRWATTTSQVETDSVTFAVGLDGLRSAPGQIITVQDPDRAGARQGGRISDATQSMVTVDRAPDQIAKGDTLTVVRPSGVSETRTISQVDGAKLYASQPFTEIPVAQSVWSVESASLALQTFRVLSVTEDTSGDKIQFTISAIQHNASKFDHIDDGAMIQVPPISKLPVGTQVPPTNVRVSSHVVVEQGIANNVMTIEWDAAGGAALYKVEWQKDSGQWIQAGTVATTSVDVVGIYTGTYVARVTALNTGNTPSLAALSQPTPVVGKTGVPPRLASLACETLIFGIRVKWSFPDGVTDTQRTEIWANTSPQRPDDPAANPAPYHMGDYGYPTSGTELHGLMAGTSLYFWGRLIDKAGNIGPWYPEAGAIKGQSSSDAAPILELLTGQIEKDQLAKDLRDTIDSVDDLAAFVQPPTPWDAELAYHKGDVVSLDGRMYRALVDVAAGGAKPGTDEAVWRDVGAVEQTAAGLAMQLSDTTLKVEELDGEVRATATKTDAVYAQVNPTPVGVDLGDKVGVDNPIKAGWVARVLAEVDSDHALGYRIETTQAQIGDVRAAVTEETKARVEGEQAMASRVTTVEAAAGDAKAQAQQAINVTAALDGKVSVTLTSKVAITADGQYYTAGYAVGIDNSSGTVQSRFLVVADRFAILPTAGGGSAVSPFVIQGGQTFISQAFIGQGWITNAMIANASIDNAKITGAIQSDAMDGTGQPLWRLDKSGQLGLRATSGSGRVEIDGTGGRVYDANGTLRVRWGIWG